MNYHFVVVGLDLLHLVVAIFLMSGIFVGLKGCRIPKMVWVAFYALSTTTMVSQIMWLNCPLVILRQAVENLPHYESVTFHYLAGWVRDNWGLSGLIMVTSITTMSLFAATYWIIWRFAPIGDLNATPQQPQPKRRVAEETR
jgi:hypothetical protein